MTRLLTIDDIAQRWTVSRAYARDVLTKLPDFPDLAPGSTRRQPRWRERDIEAYISED